MAEPYFYILLDTKRAVKEGYAKTNTHFYGDIYHSFWRGSTASSYGNTNEAPRRIQFI